MATHEVLNQPPPLADYDLFRSDRALVDAARREGAAWAEAELSAFGYERGRGAAGAAASARGERLIRRTSGRSWERIRRAGCSRAAHGPTRAGHRRGGGAATDGDALRRSHGDAYGDGDRGSYGAGHGDPDPDRSTDQLVRRRTKPSCSARPNTSARRHWPGPRRSSRSVACAPTVCCKG